MEKLVKGQGYKLFFRHYYFPNFSIKKLIESRAAMAPQVSWDRLKISIFFLILRRYFGSNEAIYPNPILCASSFQSTAIRSVAKST